MEAKTELQKNAIALARRKELETFQRALDIQWLNSRMEDGGMGRCLALISREAEMEKDFQERTDHAAIVNARAEKETALGLEIAKVRREEACELLRRHYLRERDPSLRELTRKLQAGYVCRDLRQQMLHNEYRRLQDKAEDQHANSVLHDALYNDQEAREHEERDKMERTSQYKKELQQQLVNRQRQRQCQYEETLIEKKMLEEIMRTISDEDKREIQHKREQMEKMKKEMVTFKQARDAWKEKQKRMVVLEEKQIEEQRKAVSDRSSAIVAERERKVRMKEELNEKIVAKIQADEAARLERENVIKQLQEQEMLERNVQDELAERARAGRARAEAQRALTAQVQLRRREEAQRRGREAEFRKITEAKMAAEEEKEREKERRVREKNLNYSKELLKQIEDNARRRKVEKGIEDSRARSVFVAEKSWLAEVSQERGKIIEEHAPSLLGYLQAGVVKAADLPALRDGAAGRPELAHLDVGALAAGARPRPRRFPKCNAQCRVLREY